MERRPRLFPVVMLLFLLLLTPEMGEKGVEARLCESRSHKYEGICIKSSTCAHVCRNEGFPGARCRGFIRRCFCTKQC